MGVALASSSPRRYVELVLAKTGLAAQFDAVRTGDDCTRFKPDPEIFLSAAAGLGLPPARCVVVEDAHSGILAARAAGMKVLAVASDYTLPEQAALADRLVPDLRGLGPADVTALLDDAG
jgi:beta-phosphoglucomutase-like phosphatase (HAD superfamily)